jgi:hypothetical protein
MKLVELILNVVNSHLRVSEVLTLFSQGSETLDHSNIPSRLSPLITLADYKPKNLSASPLSPHTKSRRLATVKLRRKVNSIKQNELAESNGGK